MYIPDNLRSCMVEPDVSTYLQAPSSGQVEFLFSIKCARSYFILNPDFYFTPRTPPPWTRGYTYAHFYFVSRLLFTFFCGGTALWF